MKKSRTLWHTSLCILLFASVLPQFMGGPATAVGDRSLYLTLDKPEYALGEIVTITVHIQAESCKDHGHFLDIYVYDSRGLIVRQFYLEAAPEIAIMPSSFPVKVSFTPMGVDVYTVKLWVKHSTLSRNWFVEDITTFRVVPYVTVTTQSTVVSITSPVAVTVTVTTTATTKTTVMITTTKTQEIPVDLVTIVLLLMAVAVALAIFAAYEIGKRKRLT